MAKLNFFEQEFKLLCDLAEKAYGASLTIDRVTSPGGQVVYSVRHEGERVCSGNHEVVATYITGFTAGWDAAKDIHAQEAAGADL